jgi:single stranded DNA-binding protein
MLTTIDNLVILIGRLGQDPVINSKNGKEYIRFSIGQDDNYVDKTTQLVIERTIWHSIAVFENQKSYNFIKSYVRKGDKVCVHCQLKYNIHTTTDDVKIQKASLSLLGIKIMENSKTKNINSNQSENYEGNVAESSNAILEDDIPF